MKIIDQEQRVLKRGLLKKAQPASEIAKRSGFAHPQAINGALGRLVQTGAATKIAGRPAKYAKV